MKHRIEDNLESQKLQREYDLVDLKHRMENVISNVVHQQELSQTKIENIYKNKLLEMKKDIDLKASKKIGELEDIQHRGALGILKIKEEEKLELEKLGIKRKRDILTREDEILAIKHEIELFEFKKVLMEGKYDMAKKLTGVLEERLQLSTKYHRAPSCSTNDIIKQAKEDLFMDDLINIKK